jgi:hypothetical protein
VTIKERSQWSVLDAIPEEGNYLMGLMSGTRHVDEGVQGGAGKNEDGSFSDI